MGAYLGEKEKAGEETWEGWEGEVRTKRRYGKCHTLINPRGNLMKYFRLRFANEESEA